MGGFCFRNEVHNVHVCTHTHIHTHRSFQSFTHTHVHTFTTLVSISLPRLPLSHTHTHTHTHKDTHTHMQHTCLLTADSGMYMTLIWHRCARSTPELAQVWPRSGSQS